MHLPFNLVSNILWFKRETKLKRSNKQNEIDRKISDIIFDFNFSSIR